MVKYVPVHFNALKSRNQADGQMDERSEFGNWDSVGWTVNEVLCYARILELLNERILGLTYHNLRVREIIKIKINT